MRDLSKILVTTDLSDSALPALHHAGELARRLDATLTLLYVVEDQLPPLLIGVSEQDRRGILEEHRKKAAEHLAGHAAEHLGELPVEIDTRIGVPSREIVAHAREGGHGLIVTASHGYGPVRQLLLGSTAERVLHHAPCPVLVVPSSDE